jgi:8-hydroxy-5-deazaflavin:NADPH oxidoreductase
MTETRFIYSDSTGLGPARRVIPDNSGLMASSPGQAELLIPPVGVHGAKGRAATPDGAATDGDLVVMASRFQSLSLVPSNRWAEETIIDTSTYSPGADCGVKLW